MLADAGVQPAISLSCCVVSTTVCTLSKWSCLYRVRPYYTTNAIFTWASHFRTPVAKGLEIIEGLRGHTSGFCVPTFVVDAPGGGGKIPVMPDYMISKH